MASFRKFALVAIVLVAFAGMLSAATTDSIFVSPTGYPGFRAEGLTEPVPALGFAFTGLVPNEAGQVTYDIFIYGKAGAPITSPAAALGQAFTLGTGTPGVPSILGSAVKLAGVVLTPTAGAATLTLSGVRIDANAIGNNSAVSFTVVAVPTAGISQDPANIALSQDVTVGVVNTSLKVSSTATAKDPVKGSTTVGWGGKTSDVDATATWAKSGLTSLFPVTISALYAGAFLTNGTVAAANGAAAIPPEVMRFTFSMNNIPAGLALWAPTSITVGGTNATLITGADANGAGGTAADPAAIIAARINAVGATTGQATYQLAVGGASGVFDATFNVYSSVDAVLAVTTADFSLVGSYAPLSADVSPADYTDASKKVQLLRFATTATTTLTGFLVVTPATQAVSIPYVVSDGTQTGWVTGIVIDNTGSSSVVYDTKGATGTCTLSFFSADGVMTAPASFTTPAIVPGGNYAFTLNQPAALGSANYEGPVVVKCNFDHVAVYAYITGHGSSGAFFTGR